MTVKCLTDENKACIIQWYTLEGVIITDLAYAFNTSPRTISRVLTDAGLATPLAKRAGETYQVMQILKKHNVPVNELAMVLFLGKTALLEIDEDVKQVAAAYSYPQVPMEFEDMPF